MSKKSRNHGWTREAWLAYKLAYEGWAGSVIYQVAIARAIAEMEDRED